MPFMGETEHKKTTAFVYKSAIQLFIYFCILQVNNHRTSEPLLLPADGGVDAHHRSVMCRQTTAAGSTFFCPRISAPFLRSYEHPGGGSSSQDLSAK